IANTTNDRGDYRLFWLTPGSYYIGVVPVRPDTGLTDVRGIYAKTFYPGTTDINNAAILTVHPGEELNADFKIQWLPLRRISGQIADRVAAIASPNQKYSIFLVPSEANSLVDPQLQPAITVGNDDAGQSTIKFDISRVFPGKYDMLVETVD